MYTCKSALNGSKIKKLQHLMLNKAQNYLHFQNGRGNIDIPDHI